MKCYDIGFIQTYIDGELSHDIRKEFTKHLDTCEACQDLLVEINKLNQWENVMLDEESANSPQEIKIDVEQAWKTFESRSKLDNVSNINHKKQQKKGMFTNMSKKSKRFIYTAVAGAALFTAAMIPQVQVAATNVASYFSDAITNDKVVNEGIRDENGVVQDMMKNGKYIPIDEKITDQGITVHLKELFIADSRISVHYRMEKADGSLVPFEFDTSGLDLQSDGKINGQQEENPEIKDDGRLSFIQDSDDRLPFELIAAGKKLDEIGIRDNDRPEGVSTFVITTEEKDVFKQPLTLDVNITRIGKVIGSWKAQIPIDTSHLQKNTN
ncbi:TPA: DUF4179 domain-containing protein [Bacillus cereus]|uniref:DUF4179 domain-containing protein n=1 Tax=Bacillus TaxID=1386 RepID=UPI0008643D19|nr:MULTISPECIES: DUF4179 domain-containing protein [Bacillus]MCP1177904.1 DUF4179 domain-containing protein [Bacillus sp. 1663tsa1]MCP1283070.1 DUF4179 domain-containing protein [Bacillus sp. S0635]MCQ6347720.1 DUF4179 domain-containing protein [Bacillus cereus]MCU5748192.1 DUF4179 domain-containing protein [Bacillus cereus]SCM91884.1 Transmembrane anti-sigma factor [Bacillus cereus]